MAALCNDEITKGTSQSVYRMPCIASILPAIKTRALMPDKRGYVDLGDYTPRVPGVQSQSVSTIHGDHCLGDNACR